MGPAHHAIRVAPTVVRSFHTSPEMLKSRATNFCTVASIIFSIITKLSPLHTRTCITPVPCRQHQVQAAQVSARIVGPQYELASYHPSGAKNFRKICEPLHKSADHKRHENLTGLQPTLLTDIATLMESVRSEHASKDHYHTFQALQTVTTSYYEMNLI
jgi:hypothetical protein